MHGSDDGAVAEDEIRALLLPGWLGSQPADWQGRWETPRRFERVEQADWSLPRRGDWMSRLEEVLLSDARPAWLLAHGLGCHLVSAWAAHSQHTRRVRGALLVAPLDLSRADLPAPLARWSPPIRQPLPFPAQILYADDDAHASAESVRRLARDWGAAVAGIAADGRVDGESGAGDGPDERLWLQRLRRLGR